MQLENHLLGFAPTTMIVAIVMVMGATTIMAITIPTLKVVNPLIFYVNHVANQATPPKFVLNSLIMPS